MSESDQKSEFETPADVEHPLADPTMATIALVDQPHAPPGPTAALERGGPRPRAQPPVPSEGDRIGRFVVLRKLGEGGMGLVFVGYDGELDRDVALKLLRAPHGDRRAMSRLMREGQGLARISHPNVVQVYEVGEHAGAVFITMELVVGTTLGKWLKAKPERNWPEIIHVLMQAGRGLAAVHAAGLVHRDFKPDNVMVGDDGRVRVLDFGLVRDNAERDPNEPGHAGEGPHGIASFERPLTCAGSLLGTPAYMAPEQLACESADALSDQFAFCAVAYEALFGVRPFPGRTVNELAAAIEAGRLRSPRHGRKAPRRVHDALQRGLSAEPGRRWPDMDSLLEELEISLAVRRGWMWAGLALAFVGAGVILYGLVEQARERDARLARRRQPR